MALTHEPVLSRDERRTPYRRADHPPAGLNASQRDEWILDQAVEETFPASDPTLPSRPGSTLGLRYPVARRDTNALAVMLAPFALASAFAVATFLAKRTKRGPFEG
jgi:hypothetical protein